jgi:hypothetical protein
MATMKTRPIRIPTHLWDKAIKRAHSEGTTVAARVRDWLEEYTDDNVSVTDELTRIMARLKAIRTRLEIEVRDVE